MPKLSNGTQVDSVSTEDGGIYGGGAVTGFSIAANGTVAWRCDCENVSGYRQTGDASHRSLVKWGTTHLASEWRFKVIGQYIYDVAVNWLNDQLLFKIFTGRVWKSVDGGRTWAKCAGYKGGLVDPTLNIDGDLDSRGGRKALEGDPNNPLVWALGHPVDGVYITEDGGTTWTLDASIPAPINVGSKRTGILLAFDRYVVTGGKSALYARVPGRGIYKKANSSSNAALMAGAGSSYRIAITDLQVANNVIAIAGDDAESAQVQIFNGAWSSPAGVTAYSASFRQDDPTQIVAMHGGGAVHVSTNTGANWTSLDIPFDVAPGEVPWIPTANIGYAASGIIRWESHGSVNRWHVCTGIGMFWFDNPPRTSFAQKWTNRAKGIDQMLLMSMEITADDDLLASAQDKPGWVMLANKWEQPADKTHPNAEAALRHGNDLRAVRENPSFMVGVCLGGEGCFWTGNKGKNWNAAATLPTAIPPGSPSGTAANAFAAGEIVPLTEDNWIWMGAYGGVAFTKNRGGSWALSAFKVTSGGAAINMRNARFKRDYTLRTRKLSRIPGSADVTIACIGAPTATGGASEANLNSAEDLACRGEFKTADGGETFIKTRGSYWFDYGGDFYSLRRDYNPNNGQHVLATHGAGDGPAGVDGAGLPNDRGLIFSNDQGATKQVVPGFRECEHAVFGAKRPGAAYETAYAFGWRGCNPDGTGGKRALWASYTFNAANVAAMTDADWIEQEQFPGGWGGNNLLLTAHPRVFGRVVIVIPSGNFKVRDFRFPVVLA